MRGFLDAGDVVIPALVMDFVLWRQIAREVGGADGEPGGDECRHHGRCQPLAVAHIMAMRPDRRAVIVPHLLELIQRVANHRIAPELDQPLELRGVHAHASTAFLLGVACIRAPCATASTEAAAASIRPSERAFASFALPAGSIRVMASAKAKRSSSDGATFTWPSKSARRKRSISSEPSFQPKPRMMNGTRDSRPPSIASTNSACRRRSPTMQAGACPSRRRAISASQGPGGTV